MSPKRFSEECTAVGESGRASQPSFRSPSLPSCSLPSSHFTFLARLCTFECVNQREKARRQPAAVSLRSLTFTSPSQLRVTPVCLSVWSDPLWFKSVSLPRRVSVAVVTITHRRVNMCCKARFLTVDIKIKFYKNATLLKTYF